MVRPGAETNSVTFTPAPTLASCAVPGAEIVIVPAGAVVPPDEPAPDEVPPLDEEVPPEDVPPPVVVLGSVMVIWFDQPLMVVVLGSLTATM